MSDIMSHLQKGDTLYLPGMPILGDYSFDKEVHIIGAGYHPDSSAVSGITKFLGTIVFENGCDKSSMTGVRVEGMTYVRDSIVTITRCSLGDVQIQGTVVPVSQTYLSDCLMRGTLYGINNNVTNTLIERCVIYGGMEGGDKSNMMFNNSIFLNTGNWVLSSLQNVIVQNSIILNPGNYGFLAYSSALTLRNNVFVSASFTNASFVMSNNLFSVSEADIFVDKSIENYHLKPSFAQGLTMATDGKEVGIYGTDYPFLVPTYEPRFISINNGQNLVNGKLSIKMKVEARNR
ncbi:right-handed parallel beta-helix repeat-containing protein [Parabacteroides sp. FAFU027]|uniref:right-handed parallel beta-helix repeat-containing protein n=1 Tax=Parabacteroides sp. FAFU027 TaxID=2922715 RepID=UPI001FAFD70D|nr:right-handed parallel beta-helix repeat-containing protein [Parabacteroides sp. FAFU027]